MKLARYVSLTVLLLGVIAFVMGGVFVGLGMARDLELKNAMRSEKVSLGIEGEQQSGEVIDSLNEAMVAADTIRSHRKAIAPSYSDLLGSGKFDPTNPQHLTYAQAMNLENYLYLAVVAFGLTQAVMGSGLFMLITGIAMSGTGLVLYKLSGKIA